MLSKGKLIKLLGILICIGLVLLSCGKTDTNKDTSGESTLSEVYEEDSSKVPEDEEIVDTDQEDILSDDSDISAEAYEDKNYITNYEKSGELPSVSKVYEDTFMIGVALSAADFNNADKSKLVAYQFNSITCENEMKADFTLDREATIKLGQEDFPVVNMSRAEVALEFAKDNGMKMRGHTLVWHSQTPRWLFTEGFSQKEDAPLVTRDVMLARMENYIKQELEYVNLNYPGVIYAWDVVNEAIEPGDGHKDSIRIKDNYWYEVIGEDYIEMAFTYARKYADKGQKLFYNDYGTYDKTKMYAICKLIENLQTKNLIDGMGVQDHIQLASPALLDYQYAINKYAELGIEIQVTELDIDTPEDSEEMMDQLANRYKNIFAILLNGVKKGKTNITSVTFWGLSDDRSWLNKEDSKNYPLLFDKELKPKKAFFGVLQDTSIKGY